MKITIIKNVIKKSSILLLIFNIIVTSSYSKVLADPPKKSIEFSKTLPLILGIGITSAIVFCISFTYIKLKSRSDIKETKIKNWLDVANFYININSHLDRSSPEFFENLAEYHRCLAYEDRENWLKSSENYTKAAEIYEEISKKELDKSSYNYKINFAKSFELKAKSCDCKFEFDNNEPGAEKQWQDLYGVKPSYNAYAMAKKQESIAKKNKTNVKDWEEAARLWELVKNDEELRKSFSIKSFQAFYEFAEANKQEALLKCNKTTKEKVSKAWMCAYKKDKECGEDCYEAFAAEAYLRSVLHKK